MVCEHVSIIEGALVILSVGEEPEGMRCTMVVAATPA
jgi:hypothetical protein